MKPAAPGPRVEMADNLGKQLAKTAVTAIQTAVWKPNAELEFAAFAVPLPPPAVKLGRGFFLSPVLAGQLLPSQGWVHGLRIGDRLFLGAPADYSGNLAEDLRSATPHATTIVTSFNGDYTGYILPDDYYDLTPYEPASMALYGRHYGSRFQAAFRQLAAALGR
jgi:hypothetical protein